MKIPFITPEMRLKTYAWRWEFFSEADDKWYESNSWETDQQAANLFREVKYRKLPIKPTVVITSLDGLKIYEILA